MRSSLGWWVSDRDSLAGVSLACSLQRWGTANAPSLSSWEIGVSEVS